MVDDAEEGVPVGRDGSDREPQCADHMTDPSRNSRSSYAFGAHPRPRRELERLRRQALIAWREEKAWLRRLGLTDGMRVLDVGCGPGVLTAKLAELNPSGETVGLEPDRALAAIAARAFQGQPGLSLHAGSITENALPDAHFDFVYVRFVLQHLSSPLVNVRALMRVIRPGGRLVLADADDGLIIFYPEPPELAQILGALEARQARAGGDRRVGRKLPVLLGEAGFSDVGFHVVPFTSHGLGRGPLLELVVTSRLLSLCEDEEPGIDEKVASMLAYLERSDWHGTAGVIAAFGTRPAV